MSEVPLERVLGSRAGNNCEANIGQPQLETIVAKNVNIRSDQLGVSGGRFTLPADSRSRGILVSNLLSSATAREVPGDLQKQNIPCAFPGLQGYLAHKKQRPPRTLQ